MRKITLILFIIFSINYLYSQIVFEMISPEDSLVNEYLKTGSVLKLEVIDAKKKFPITDYDLYLKNINKKNIDTFHIKNTIEAIVKLEKNTEYLLICNKFSKDENSKYLINSEKIKTLKNDILRVKIPLTKITECLLPKLEINYHKNSIIINNNDSIFLNDFFRTMLKFPNMEVEFHSHSDCTEKNPLELSMKRSKAVFDYLVSKGIDRSRLKYFGYGAVQSQSACDCYKKCTEAQLQNDRRTEFKIIRFK